MNIDTPETTFKNIDFNKQEDFQKLLKHISNSVQTSGYHLCLFLGHYEPSKEKALKDFCDATGLEARSFDLNEIVSKSESETFENLDLLFSQHSKIDSILYFTNGDKLCGVYTGFTHSKVKYATPQERYFLKKVQEYKGIVIVDITEYNAADKTIRRAAQSIVRFPLPKSSLQRFIWHLKHYSLHGFDLKTKRPDVYEDANGSA